jgi:hypothetical protein
MRNIHEDVSAYEGVKGLSPAIATRTAEGTAVEVDVTIRKLRNVLGRYAFRYSSEMQIQERIADVLRDEGFSFEREVELDAKSRADFLVDGCIVIEVKIDGDMGSALAQARRYSNIKGVSGVLLASACGWARSLPEILPTSAVTTRGTGEPMHSVADAGRAASIQVVQLKRQAL